MFRFVFLLCVRYYLFSLNKMFGSRVFYMWNIIHDLTLCLENIGRTVVTTYLGYSLVRTSTLVAYWYNDKEKESGLCLLFWQGLLFIYYTLFVLLLICMERYVTQFIWIVLLLCHYISSFLINSKTRGSWRDFLETLNLNYVSQLTSIQ